MPQDRETLDWDDYFTRSISVDVQYLWSTEEVRTHIQDEATSDLLDQMMAALGEREHVLGLTVHNVKAAQIKGNFHACFWFTTWIRQCCFQVMHQLLMPHGSVSLCHVSPPGTDGGSHPPNHSH